MFASAPNSYYLRVASRSPPLVNLRNTLGAKTASRFSRFPPDFLDCLSLLQIVLYFYRLPSGFEDFHPVLRIVTNVFKLPPGFTDCFPFSKLSPAFLKFLFVLPSVFFNMASRFENFLPDFIPSLSLIRPPVFFLPGGERISHF